MTAAIVQLTIFIVCVCIVCFFTRPKKVIFNAAIERTSHHLMIIRNPSGDIIFVWHNDGRFSMDMDGRQSISPEVAAEVWRRWHDEEMKKAQVVHV